MSEKDPTRLASLADVPELPELLRSARRLTPDDAMVQRLAERLGVMPGNGGGGGPPAPPPAAPPLRTLVAGKTTLAGATIAVAGAGWFIWNLLHPRPDRVPVTSMAPSAAASQMAVQAPPVATPQSTPATRRSASDGGASSSTASPSVPPAAADVASKVPRVAARSEAAILGEARAALHVDPARALQLTREHAKTYPHGVLADEREVIAIEALAAMGKVDEARARARAFEAASPGTPYARRIERATGVGDAIEHPDEVTAPKSIAPSKKTP